MQVLITGASGFLGRAVTLATPTTWTVHATYRASEGFPGWVRDRGLTHVRPVRVDLSSAESVEALAGQISDHVDAILHLAANGDPARSVQDPRSDLMAGPAALVTLLQAVSTERLVYVSSGAVYDGLSGLVGPDTRLDPVLPYAIAKVTCEQYVKHFTHTRRSGSYVILRFFGAYGPFEPERKIFTRLVRWAASSAGEPFSIRGDGQNLIDAMYVDDVARTLVDVVRSTVSNVTVDFGCSRPITVDDLVARVAAVLGRLDPRLRHIGEVPEYIRFHVSSEQMERLFNFRPQVPLEEGVVRLRDHLTRVAVAR